jgi:hypothetical protein
MDFEKADDLLTVPRVAVTTIGHRRWAWPTRRWWSVQGREEKIQKDIINQNPEKRHKLGTQKHFFLARSFATRFMDII